MSEYMLMRLRWLIPPISLLLVLSLASLYAVLSRYPERMALHIARKAVERSGGTLRVEGFHGTLKKGLTFEKVEFRNGPVVFKARSFKMRIRTTPLIFGVFWFKELSVRHGEIFISGTSAAKEKARNPIPLWLTAYSRNTSVDLDRIEIDRGAGDPVVLENVEMRAAAAVKFGRLALNDLSTKVATSPIGRTASFNGSLALKPGTWFNCDGIFSAGDSKGKLSASYRSKKGSPVMTAQISNASIFLRDMRALAEFPDLRLDCSGKLTLTGKHLKIKTTVEEKGYGKFTADGEGEVRDGIVEGNGDVSADPFYYSLGIPQIRSDRIMVRGTFRSDFAYDTRKKKLRCVLNGKIRDSEILNIPIVSGDARMAVDGKNLSVASAFESRVIGKGSVEIEHDLESFLTSVRFSSKGTLSRSTVDALGVEIPLPKPLVFSENAIDIGDGELLFDGENVNVSIRAKDAKGGAYGVDCFFRKLDIFDLGLELRNIDPGLWGFPTPFTFRGDLGFKFTEPGATPATLAQGWFDFPKGSLGPIDTPFSILPSGTLVIPRCRVPFPGGSAEITGEISEEGGFSGEGTADLSSYDFAPEPARALLDGAVSSSFRFRGDFSGIDLEGSARSPRFVYSGLSAKDAEIKGSASIAKGALSVNARCRIESVSLSGTTAGRTEIELEGPLTEARFVFSSAMDEGREIKLGGTLGFGKEGFRSRIERGAIRTGVRNLYLSGTPEISAGDGTLSWKDVVLLSGESRLSSRGSFPLSPGKGEMEADLTLENFSIVLLPLPEDLASLRGKVDGELKVGGTAASPKLEGEVLFKNLTYPLPGSDLKIVGMAGLKFEGDTVKLDNCYFSTNEGGDADLGGRTRIVNFLPEDMDISLDARDFPVIYGKDFEALIDAGVKLTGSWAEPHVEGGVHFLKGKIQLPEAVKNPELPQSITFVNAPREDERLRKNENALLEKIRGGLLFTSKGKLWISRSDIVGELGGRVLVKFTKNGVIPEGNLSVLSGRFLLQGSKFELKDSSLYFSEGRDLYPILDIKASKEIGDYEVTVKLQGRVEKPTLSLSSIPPLEEGEILSLILFGRTSQNLNPEEHAAWGGAAAAVAFNYEATPVMRSVSKALRVDSLLVGTSESGDAQVGFSKYLSDRFVLEYQQTFGNLPETRVNLRYRINRHLSLETISSTAGKSGADLTWEQKY